MSLIAFPAGIPVEAMPHGKVVALALFVVSLILVAGSIVAWLVGGFKTSSREAGGDPPTAH